MICIRSAFVFIRDPGRRDGIVNASHLLYKSCTSWNELHLIETVCYDYRNLHIFACNQICGETTLSETLILDDAVSEILGIVYYVWYIPTNKLFG